MAGAIARACCGFVAAALPALAGAAEPGTATAEEALARARQAYGVETVQRRCRPSAEGEIVVCADRGEDLRVPSTAESDPNSLAARHVLNNGVPRAPQLDRGSCKGQPGCIVGGWAPPPLYIIDMKAIPEAPEGSDADKIAKGEMAER